MVRYFSYHSLILSVLPGPFQLFNDVQSESCCMRQSKIPIAKVKIIIMPNRNSFSSSWNGQKCKIVKSEGNAVQIYHMNMDGSSYCEDLISQTFEPSSFLDAAVYYFLDRYSKYRIQKIEFCSQITGFKELFGEDDDTWNCSSELQALFQNVRIKCRTLKFEDIPMEMVILMIECIQAENYKIGVYSDSTSAPELPRLKNIMNCRGEVSLQFATFGSYWTEMKCRVLKVEYGDNTIDVKLLQEMCEEWTTTIKPAKTISMFWVEVKRSDVEHLAAKYRGNPTKCATDV